MKAKLEPALRVLKHLVPKKTRIPVLDHVRLECLPEDKAIALEATDLDTYAQIVVPADGDLPRPLLVPLYRLSALLGKGQEIMLDRGHRLTVGAASMDCPMDVAEFPACPEMEPHPKAMALDPGQVARALEWLLPAVSDDPTRESLTGICLDGESWQSTDGHRLHVYGLPGFQARPVMEAGAARTLLAFIRVARPTSLHVLLGRPYFMIAAQGPTMTLGMFSRAKDSTFPCVDEVLPKGPEQIAVAADGLSALVARAAAIVDRKPLGPVALHVNGALEVKASNSAGEAFRAAMPYDRLAGEDEDITVGLNAAYLTDVLARSKGERVALGFGSNADCPLVVRKTDGAFAVVMPMRL